MKTLKSYVINENSILTNLTDNLKHGDEAIKKYIIQFIENNYEYDGKLRISSKPNKDGKYEVSSSKDVWVKNKNIISLTNDIFVWKTVKTYFGCVGCEITSLNGAPEEVNFFDCSYCNNLSSLEGAPKKVYDFDCSYCYSLISLEGAPGIVKGKFDCSGCKSLNSFKGKPLVVGKFSF